MTSVQHAPTSQEEPCKASIVSPICKGCGTELKPPMSQRVFCNDCWHILEEYEAERRRILVAAALPLWEFGFQPRHIARVLGIRADFVRNLATRCGFRKYSVPKVRRTCKRPGCNREIEARPNRHRRKYCSPECSQLAQRVVNPHVPVIQQLTAAGAQRRVIAQATGLSIGRIDKIRTQLRQQREEEARARLQQEARP